MALLSSLPNALPQALSPEPPGPAALATSSSTHVPLTLPLPAVPASAAGDPQLERAFAQVMAKVVSGSMLLRCCLTHASKALHLMELPVDPYMPQLGHPQPAHCDLLTRWLQDGCSAANQALGKEASGGLSLGAAPFFDEQQQQQRSSLAGSEVAAIFSGKQVGAPPVDLGLCEGALPVENKQRSSRC